MDAKTTQAIIDYAAALVNNAVGGEPAKGDDWVELTIHRPDTVSFDTIRDLQRNPRIHDVTLRCVNDTVGLRIHVKRDEALEKQNHAERTIRRNSTLLPLALPADMKRAQKESIQEVYAKLYLELPSFMAASTARNQTTLEQIEFSEHNYTLVARMAPDARISVSDLERVHVALSGVDSTLKIHGRDNHLFVSVYDTSGAAPPAANPSGNKRGRFMVV